MPQQDKQYLIGFAQLPDGSTLDRTEDVIRRMGEIMMKQPGVENAVAFPGLSINGFTNSSNSGIVFAALEDFDKRKSPSLSGGAIAGGLNQQFAGIPDAFIVIFPPPPVQGLGTTGGFKLLHRGPRFARLRGARRRRPRRSSPRPTRRPSSPACSRPTRSTCRSSTPTSTAPRRASSASPVTEVFDTMQIYLGSLYVNDFNKFGRTYSVRVQADARYRARAEDVGLLKVRSNTGEMVPLSALMA